MEPTGTLSKLKSKFPSSTSSLTEQQIHQLEKFSSDDESILTTSEEVTEKALKSTKSATAPGTGKLRPEHLKQLLSLFGSMSADVTSFRKSLTDITTAPISAKVPQCTQSFFRDFELTPVPKGEADVRPTCLQSLLKKLTISVAIRNQNLKVFSSAHFSDTQVCLSPRCTESTSLQLRAAFELYSEHGKLFFDGDSGFNKCSRGQGLLQVVQHFPALYPLASVQCGKSGSAFTHSSSEGTKAAESCEGAQQGDAVSVWLHSVTTQPLVSKAQEVASSSTSFGVSKWCADDGSTLIPLHLMTEVLQVLQSGDPHNGYFTKLSKCKYLTGYCVDPHEATERKRSLTQLGFLEDSATLHPSSEGGEVEEGEDEDGVRNMQEVETAAWTAFLDDD